MQRLGITEQYWTSLTQDEQFYWKFLTRTVTMGASFFIAKTGVDVLDKIIMVFTAILRMLIVEGQRAHTRLSARLSKRLLRVGLSMATIGVVLVGGVYFSIAIVNALSHTYQSVAHLKYSNNCTAVVMIGMVFVATPIAAWRVFRGTQYWELIYTVPRQQLVKLLVGRRYKALNGFEFCRFELSVIFLCLMYAHVLALCVTPFVQVAKVLIGS